MSDSTTENIREFLDAVTDSLLGSDASLRGIFTQSHRRFPAAPAAMWTDSEGRVRHISYAEDEKITLRTAAALSSLLPGLERGADAGHKRGADAGHKRGADAGHENGAVAGLERGADAGLERGADAGHENGADAGLERGAVVGLQLQTGVGFSHILWGVLMNGRVPLLLDPARTPGELSSILKNAGAAAVISDRELTDGFGVPVIRAADVAGAAYKAGGFVPVWEDRIIFCSSGTTGEPKLCVWHGESLCRQIAAARMMYRENTEIIYPPSCGDLRILAFLPFHHVFGFVACYLWYTFFSKTIVYTRSRQPGDINRLCRQLRVTHIFAVPAFWNRLYAELEEFVRASYPEYAELYLEYLCGGEAGRDFLKHYRRFNAVLRERFLSLRVRYCISGGGHPSRRVMTAFNRLGLFMCNGYGMTECGVVAVELSDKPGRRSLCSIGKPLYGVRFGLTAKRELVIDSSYAPSGRLADGVEVGVGGPVYTGDIAALGADGEYYLIGRKKQLIIGADGENISPDEIEDVFRALPGASGCCVFPEHTDTGDVPAIAVGIPAGADDTKVRDIACAVTRLACTLPPNRQPARLYVTRLPLPPDAKGEVRRESVLRMTERNPDAFILCERRDGTFFDDGFYGIAVTLREIWAGVLRRPADGIGFFSHFQTDMGGDSFLYATLIYQVEQTFGIQIARGDSFAFTTVGTGAQVIKRVRDASGG